MSALTKVLPEPVRELARTWAGPLLFERQLRRATPVVIHQMGKVGSSSVYGSLLRQYDGIVRHTHIFRPRNVRDRQIRRLYAWTADGQPIKIISLVREPIARNVSAFFQNFRKETGVSYAASQFSTAELQQIFLAHHQHDLPLTWFDKHIHRHLGIDVYAAPFPEGGVATYRRGNLELLLLRVEVDDRVKVAAIAEFAGLEDFHLQTFNVGEQKDYADLYKTFKRELQLPDAYIARMCDSKYFNHFYSREFIEATRQRWSRT